MRQERTPKAATKTEAALQELRERISERYPSATFGLARDSDEPSMVLLMATVDVDDPDEVLDSVMDRLLQMQVEERIPVQVIPVRTPERIEADLRRKPVERGHLTLGRMPGRAHPPGA